MTDVNPMEPVPFIDINTATPQEVYDWAVLSILTQGRPSITPDDSARMPTCNYELTNPNGEFVRCIAGQLLSKTQLKAVRDSGFLAEEWGSLVDEKIVPRRHKRLISDLQAVHDDATDNNKDFITEFIIGAKRLAEDHHFNDDVLMFAGKDADSAEALSNLQSIGIEAPHDQEETPDQRS